MLGWGLDFLEGLAGFVSDPVGTVTGWTFDKVTAGIYEWLARGLALLIEWVWQVLDAGTTPRVTADWYANELAGRVGSLALAVTIAMMLASGIQAGLAGRPEQVSDAVKAAARAILATAVTITVVDMTIGIVDEASAAVWQIGRADLVAMIEHMVEVTTNSPMGATFIGPLCLLFGFLGLFGLSVTMLMRSAMIYLVAALAPLVWSSSVLPIMRDSSRRLVHLLVALVVSKLAIVISLVVAVQLAANAGGDPNTPRADLDAAAAVGTLVTGFACFLVAAVSPMVLYRLMPTVEGAVASAGVVSGWGRAAMSVGQAALMTKGLGAAAAATRAVAGQQGVAGSAGGAGGQAVTGLAAASRAASARTPANGGAGGETSERSGGAESTDVGSAKERHPSAAGASMSSASRPRPDAGGAGRSGAPSELPPLPRTPSGSGGSPGGSSSGPGAAGPGRSGPAGGPSGGQL
jgi:hypothetical protein